ncbi:hypothetical protein [Pedobacter antarcticus]|uniref:hypothetical protein n=1 Tax=Pedobacter antarcticus TaxID=34086 RepID=UPI00292FC095|nr:hypothetical protein [Pedobacter antarcticus]
MDQENAYYLVSPKGTVAYFDRQYLIDGRESTFKKTKEIVLFSLAITTLIVTIFTFLSNVLLTKKNNEEIKVLQKEMKIFSNRSKPES